MRIPRRSPREAPTIPQSQRTTFVSSWTSAGRRREDADVAVRRRPRSGRRRRTAAARPPGCRRDSPGPAVLKLFGITRSKRRSRSSSAGVPVSGRRPRRATRASAAAPSMSADGLRRERCRRARRPGPGRHRGGPSSPGVRARGRCRRGSWPSASPCGTDSSIGHFTALPSRPGRRRCEHPATTRTSCATSAGT